MEETVKENDEKDGTTYTARALMAQTAHIRPGLGREVLPKSLSHVFVQPVLTGSLLWVLCMASSPRCPPVTRRFWDEVGPTRAFRGYRTGTWGYR